MELRNLSQLRAKLEAHGLDAIVAVDKKSVLYLSHAPTAWGDWQQRRADGPRICFVVWPRTEDPLLIVGELEREVTPEYSLIPRIEHYREYAQSPYEKLAEVLNDLGLRGKRVGIEIRAIGAGYWEQLREAHRETTFVEAGPLLDQVRAKKTDAEIAIFRHACAMLDRVFLSAFSRARPGMTERNLELLMINTAHAMGGTGVRGNALSGERAMVVHRPAGDRRIGPGDIIRTDFIAYWDGRPANLSRAAVVGKPSHQQQATYRALWEIERAIFEFIKPGVSTYEVFEFYWRAAQSRGLQADLPLLGHNIGLDTHEDPMIAQADSGTLEERMVICIEPLVQKQYHLQDQLAITGQGVELLSKDFDTRELFVIT